ncbi:RIO1 family regulatory kinase/ATPase [Pseudonocardia benzenivorans]
MGAGRVRRARDAVDGRRARPLPGVGRGHRGAAGVRRVGDRRRARLAQLRPDADELADLWAQLGEALRSLARQGLTHGDLSAFNVLVDRGRLVLIDLPQVVDVVGNPFGPSYLGRDVDRITEWYAARGLPDAVAARDALFDDLLAELGIAQPGSSHR